MKIQVTLNGTDTNPWHALGFRMNPFPIIGRAEYDQADLVVRSLGAYPIPDVEYIRHRLEGFSDEFIEICCREFKKGEMVRFTVEWPEENDR